MTEPKLHIIDDAGSLVSLNEMYTFFESTLSGEPASPTSFQHIKATKACGVRYHVVGVFGGQSSGKSTLLNELFKTNFETMDEASGRHQTTKGAFMAKFDQSTDCGVDEEAPTKENSSSALFVMDFEGTDGIERGEDQSFERQLSLFALSVADTLIINMWAVDVGRYNAANMSLLRTIFEVNLQLFSHDSYRKDEKPTLLIVLRDFTEDDLQRYSDIVVKSLNKIWESVAKPPSFENAEITSLFHLRFYGLAHFKLQREKFDAGVREFRRWFLDPLCPKYVFDSIASFRNIPLEVLPQYFGNCWQAIQHSKDLDIPSQREMIARHRCTESAESAQALFAAATSGYNASIDKGELIVGLEAALDALRSKASEEFNAQTKLYSRRVVKEYADKLEAFLNKAATELRELQTTKVATECLRNVNDEVQAIVDDSLRALLSHKDLLNGRATATDCSKFTSLFWEAIAQGLVVLEDRLANGNGLAFFGKYKKFVETDNVTRERALPKILKSMNEMVKLRIAQMASDACGTMTKGFDYVLTHKDDGSVRSFATTAGLQNVFPAARLAGLLVLSCIFYCRQKCCDSKNAPQLDEGFALQLPTFENGDNNIKYPEDVVVADNADDDEDLPLPSLEREASCVVGRRFNGVDPHYIVMSKAAVRRAFELYNQQIQFNMQMQLRTIESSQQNIPMWMWVLVLVLGHNEMYFVATSPILLIFLIAIAYFFFSSWIVAQWQRFEETGPQGVVMGIKAVAAMAQPYLKKVHSQPDGTKKAQASVAEEEKKKN